MVLLAGVSYFADAQKITINAAELPLNEVFFRLRDVYGMQFSFSDRMLAKYRVSLSRDFLSQDDAVKFLLKDIPLSYQKENNVFIIYPDNKPGNTTKNVFKINGRVLESGSFEPLPFSNIVINHRPVYADRNGDFMFIASADSAVDLQIAHLGYFHFDTIIATSVNKEFLLTPSVKEIGEVRIENNEIERATLIGNQGGAMQVNHTVAPYLPGSSQNSIFSTLRLMPGILAAGEQSSDFFIWGAYEGQSKIAVDKITLFGLKHYNDNIGAVNPLYIQKISIKKSGFGATFEDRVGGIVDIAGKHGNNYKPAVKATINNTTLNLLGEVPLSKKTQLLAAFRTTYYELYNPYNLTSGFGNMESGSGSHGGNMGNYHSMVDVEVIPDYHFNDANLKYSFNDKKGADIQLVGYWGKDRYAYNLSNSNSQQNFQNNLKENSLQNGASVLASKKWKNGSSESLSVSYSAYEFNFNESSGSSSSGQGMDNRHGMGENTAMTGVSSLSQNTISETGIEYTHIQPFFNGINISGGVGSRLNRIELLVTNNNQEYWNTHNNASRFYSFIQADLPLTKTLFLQPGLRVGYAKLSNTTYYAPRLSASWEAFNNFKVNFAWGRYHQFFTKISFIDENQNYISYWLNGDNITIPIQKSEQWVGGLNYNKNGWLFNLEAFRKQTQGISRYYSTGTETPLLSGDSHAYGLDIYAKKEFQKNVIWATYSFGKVTENLLTGTSGQFYPSPHDQRHEFKAAGIYNLKSFYFSMAYIFGSGFEILRSFSPNETIRSYSRLDAAITYKFRLKKTSGNVGVSVLNITNRQNIKYSNIRSVLDENNNNINIYTGATPFSPSVFLKIGI